METSAISALNVTKAYAVDRSQDPTVVLDDVSVEVEQGTMVAIVGQSGAGKSTLLYCLSGLEAPDSGRVSLLGEDLAGLTPSAVARIHRGRVGFVFQTLNLVPSLTARENVLLPARLARTAVDPHYADEVLVSMGLRHRITQVTSRLSLGEQQRVALARILYGRPPLVFADEPTGSLDSVSGARALATLRSLTDVGQTVVMVTHDLDAAALADTVLVMRDGRIAARLASPTSDQLWSVLHSAAVGR